MRFFKAILYVLVLCIYCQNLFAKANSYSSMIGSVGYGELGEVDIQHSSVGLEVATEQKLGLVGIRFEQIHFAEHKYKGMGSNQLFQIHAIYAYEKSLSNQNTCFSFKAGAPLMSLGNYQITDFYNDSEVSAPYLPQALRSGWDVQGEKTISSYGFWLELGLQQNLPSVSSETFTHKIGGHLNHFFYRFDAVSGYLEAHHPNGSYIISDGKELSRRHIWQGRSFALSYQVNW